MTKKNRNLEIKFQDLLLGGENVGTKILNNGLDIIGSTISNAEDLSHAFMNKVCQVEVLAYLLEKEKPDLKDVIDFIKSQSYESFINLLGDVEALSDVDADFIDNVKEIEKLFDEMEDLDDDYDEYEDLSNDCPL